MGQRALAGKRDRRVALLRAAPIRGDLLEPCGPLGFRGRRSKGQLVLRSAALPPLAHGIDRLSPHPSSRQPDSKLSPARMLRGESRATAPRQTRDAVGQPQIDTPRALGREYPEAGELPSSRPRTRRSVSIPASPGGRALDRLD